MTYQDSRHSCIAPALFLIASGLLLGCGGEASGSGGASSASNSTTTTAVSSSSSSTSASASSGGSAVCTAAETLLPSPCADCIAAACGAEWANCCGATTFDAGGVAKLGCVPLAQCAIETGCKHVTCYQDSTCKAQVDGAGGVTGQGTSSAATVGACIEAAAASNASCAQCLVPAGG